MTIIGTTRIRKCCIILTYIIWLNYRIEHMEINSITRNSDSLYNTTQYILI